MSNYAVIETGGKQYRVEEGTTLEVERLPAEEGKKVEFDQVLALHSGSELTIGTPLVAGAKVTGEVVDHHRGDKVIAFKKKRRKGYKRKVGHRQELTQVTISSLGKKAAKKAAPKKEKIEEAAAE